MVIRLHPRCGSKESLEAMASGGSAPPKSRSSRKGALVSMTAEVASTQRKDASRCPEADSGEVKILDFTLLAARSEDVVGRLTIDNEAG